MVPVHQSLPLPGQLPPLKQEHRGHGRHGAQYFHPKVDLVGDMHELPGLLELVGFRFNATLGTPNNATANGVKANQWPREASLLSQRTLEALCNYLALDYHLFDFPPARCRGRLAVDLAALESSAGSSHRER